MTRPKRQRNTSGGGYTLVEVLVVVVILGIASAFVVPQLLAAGTLGIQAAARLVVADILFAQNEAIAAQENREVVFNASGNTYRLQRFNADTGLDEVLTQGWKNGQANNYVVDFEDDDRFDGITIESVQIGGSDATSLEFDDLGSPLISDEMQIVIGFDQQRLTVSVQPFTGRVTVD
ncbi:MAG: prepilin-type N-terminal cleavage/methylation domain-containing protein [Planctomycetota bacterium]